MSVSSTFETTNRALEQFLFLHDIRHTSWYKNEENLTVWVYEKTEETMRVVDEYREICRRRAERTNERRGVVCGR